VRISDHLILFEQVTMSERQLHLFKSRRQRGTVAPPPLEFAVHCAVADTLKRWATPTWIWTHLPFGEHRTAITGARLKRLGTQPGWPDFIFLAPLEYGRRPFFLELKRRGAKLTEHQAGFALWCQLNDCPHAVTSDYETAVKILQGWGALRMGVNVQ
jgi:hypothetical protein